MSSTAVPQYKYKYPCEYYEIVRDGNRVCILEDLDDATFVYGHLADGGKQWKTISLVKVVPLAYTENRVELECRFR